MAECDRVAADEDFLHYKPQDLLTLSHIQRFGSRP
jgi:hypothetical protein